MGQIALVLDHDALDAGGQPSGHGAVGRRHAAPRIDDLQDHVGTTDLPPAPLDADPLHRVVGLAQAGGIDDVQRNTLDLDGLAQSIARRAGDLGDDRPLLAGQAIQQRTLADIGQARQHHRQAGPQQAALAGPAAQAPTDRTRQALQARHQVGVAQRVDLLVGKVERRLDQHAQLDQLVHQAMDLARKLAGQRAQRRAGRLRRAGLDQVGNRLGLGQVQLVVEKGTAGELARLRQPRTEFQAASQQLLHHHWAAVALQFEHVLAGKGMRRGKVEQDALIDSRASRVAEADQACQARRRPGAGQPFGKAASPTPGDTHDADATTAGRRGNGGDVVRLSVP